MWYSGGMWKRLHTLVFGAQSECAEHDWQYLGTYKDDSDQMVCRSCKQRMHVGGSFGEQRA
jgi:hypothetical protein